MDRKKRKERRFFGEKFYYKSLESGFDWDINL